MASGQVSNVVYQRAARKEKEVGERPKSTAYRWDEVQSLLYTLFFFFFFAAARERKDKKQLMGQQLWLYLAFCRHSHRLLMAVVGVTNCHLLYESPAVP